MNATVAEESEGGKYEPNEHPKMTALPDLAYSMSAVRTRGDSANWQSVASTAARSDVLRCWSASASVEGGDVEWP
jgi:hypothetical protein